MSIDDSVSDEASLHSLCRVNLADPDIQNVFKKSYSLEDLPNENKRTDQSFENDFDQADGSSLADGWVCYSAATTEPYM